MELECQKFKESMPSDKAYCRHTGDYCKYRTSCIIWFLEKENPDRCPAEDTKKKEDSREKDTEDK